MFYNIVICCQSLLRKTFLDKDIFKEKLLRNLRYYFWSKSEWELILRITEDSHIYLIPWCGCKDPEEVKIDVTNDESFDWLAFVDFVKNKKNIHNEAKIDVFDQINFRIDEFTDMCWNALINNTKKGNFL